MTPLHFAQSPVLGIPRIQRWPISRNGCGRFPFPCAIKGSDQFAARFKKVAKDRRKWARKNDISCYRIYDADLPDFAVAIDRYDGVWKSEGQSCLIVAEYQAPKTIDQAKAEARFRGRSRHRVCGDGHSVGSRVRENAPPRKGRRSVCRPAKRGLPHVHAGDGQYLRSGHGGAIRHGHLSSTIATRAKWWGDGLTASVF